MTVNVTPVNDPPTSTGGSVIMRINTVKTFTAANFQFSDVDTGDTLQAIMVTSLSTHGTLNLGGTPVSTNDVVPVADIGSLTYTPNTGYSGPDSFTFQVSDGMTYSVADATMAITVTPGIVVLNGGFEDPTPHNPNNGTNPDWTAGGWAFVGAPWTTSTANYGRLSQGPVASPQLGNWMVNLNDSGGWVKQNLGEPVNAGDTLSVTFSVMSDTAPGEIAASFLVGDGPTEYSQTFNNPQNNGTWVPYTLTQTIAVSGNLSLKFSQVSGRLWLDNVSNISVTTGGTVSRPTVSGITADGSGNVVISGTTTGTSVITEKSTDLGANPIVWTPVSTNAVTAGAFSVTNAIGADPKAFFRVKNQ
jgi:hypothetical protein